MLPVGEIAGINPLKNASSGRRRKFFRQLPSARFTNVLMESRRPDRDKSAIADEVSRYFRCKLLKVYVSNYFFIFQIVYLGFLFRGKME
jgi:hypothetical protein